MDNNDSFTLHPLLIVFVIIPVSTGRLCPIVVVVKEVGTLLPSSLDVKRCYLLTRQKEKETIEYTKDGLASSSV